MDENPRGKGLGYRALLAGRLGYRPRQPIRQNPVGLVNSSTSLRKPWTSPYFRVRRDAPKLLPPELMINFVYRDGRATKFELAFAILNCAIGNLWVVLELSSPSPLSVGPALAAQSFVMWNVATDRRIAKNRWALETQNMESKESSEAASRNVFEARVRLGLEQARGQAGLETALRDQNGDVIADSSGDEFIPTVSNDAFLADASFPALDPTWNQIGNPVAPKREAEDEPSDVPDPKIPMAGDAAESGWGDSSLTQRHTIGLPEAQFVAAVSKDQRRRERRGLTRGWFSYAAL